MTFHREYQRSLAHFLNTPALDHHVHLNMGILFLVSLEVDFQVPFSGEAIAADVALEWPLPSVRTQVDRKAL